MYLFVSVSVSVYIWLTTPPPILSQENSCAQVGFPHSLSLYKTATYVDNWMTNHKYKYKHLEKRNIRKFSPINFDWPECEKPRRVPVFTGAYDVEKQESPWLPIFWNLLIYFYNDICHHTVSRPRRLVTVDIFKIYLFVERTAS